MLGINPLGQRSQSRLRIQHLLAQHGEIRIVPDHAEGHFLAPQRLVLAQRMPDPIPRQEDAAQVGVALVVNAHQIVGLALHAEGRLPQRVEAGHGRLAVRTIGRHGQADAPAVRDGEEVVDAGKALLAAGPGALARRQLAAIDGGQVGKVDKLQSGLIAQKARHRQQIAGMHGEIDLAVSSLHIHQRGREALLEPRLPRHEIQL
ncbi:MAG: hypothetical protein V9H69_24300 [Anaerolineae bacterium]